MSWYFCWPGFRKSRYLLYDTTCPRGTLVASRRRKIERKSISQGPRFALRLNASLCLVCLRDRRKNSNVWPRNIADDPASLVVEAIETINRPSRPDLVKVFWNDWGDRDDPDDHDSEIVPINKKRVSKGVCIRRFLNWFNIKVILSFYNKRKNNFGYPYSDPNSRIHVASKASRDKSIGNAETKQ